MKQDWTKITACGLWPSKQGPRSCNADDLGEPPSENEIATCRTWLRLFAAPTKRIQTAFGSYYLKHLVEHWGGRLYVSNGAFIEAAKREGYRFKRVIPGSQNANFNFSVRTIRMFSP